MTRLRIQTLEIADCEARIERGYFDEGRVSDGPSPDPDWDEASCEKRKCIARRGYALYDGFPCQPGNEVGLPEIYASIGINSGVLSFDAVRFLRRSAKARPLLAKIPDLARLEESSGEQIEAAAKLIDLFTCEKRIALGKTTKILHKKRPKFIPVLDSVVENFLRKNFPYCVKGESCTAAMLSVYKMLLVERSDTLCQIQAVLEPRGFVLSTVRILDFLIWLKWRKSGSRSGKPLPTGKPKSIVEVWGVESLPQAHEKACKIWEEQRRENRG